MGEQVHICVVLKFFKLYSIEENSFQESRSCQVILDKCANSFLW